MQALPAACRALTGSKSARVSVVDDLWVPLKLFATIAAQLGVGERLAPLLDRKTLHAWSLDDGEEGGILHNWKIPAQLISPNSYSTNAMLECVWPRSPRVQYDLADTYLDMSYSVDFDHMVMLAESVQLRTPLDRNSIRLDYTFRSDRSGGPTSFEVLLAQSVGWLSLAYEAWRDGLDADAGSSGLVVGESAAQTEGPDSATQLLWATKTVRGLTALTIDSRCIETIAPEYPPESLQLVDGLASLIAQAWRTDVQGGQGRSVSPPPTHADTLPARPSQTAAPVVETAVAQSHTEKRQAETWPHAAQQQANDLVADIRALQARVSALEVQAQGNIAPPREACSEQTGPRTQADYLARLKPWTIFVVVLVSHVLVSFGVESCRSVWAAVARLYDRGHAAILS